MGAYHFTHQPVVPVRGEASDAAEMVTQLLFGDLVQVLERNRQWLRIRNKDDDYEGWIDEKMVLAAGDDWLSAIRNWKYIRVACADLKASWHGEHFPLRLGPGCRIPVFSDTENSGDHSFSLGNWSMEVPMLQANEYTTDQALDVIEMSALYLGSPYLWGGKSIWGIDCSGLTQIVYAMSGRRIPRDASQQEKVGESVQYEHRRAGDLAFFRNEKGRVHHVGIVTSNGGICHAHGYVREDLLEPEGIVGKYAAKLTHNLCCIKRIN